VRSGVAHAFVRAVSTLMSTYWTVKALRSAQQAATLGSGQEPTNATAGKRDTMERIAVVIG